MKDLGRRLRRLFISAAAVAAVYSFFNIHRSTPQHTAEAHFYELAPARLTTAASVRAYEPLVYDVNELTDIASLMKNIYAVDKKTIMTPELFNVSELLGINSKISADRSGPKVLIFHTHANELYADSNGKAEGVCGAGEYLKKLLEEKYGIEVMHVTEDFDMQNGRMQRNGAYERAEPYIKRILKENPSIEFVIDLHRDGVSDDLRLVKDIDGKKYAKIMFFNGLCQKNVDGRAESVGLENPYLKQNLALSFKMQLALDKAYPGVSRKIYLNAYRYSLHMLDKSMLIELGAQTNTCEEVKNSIEILAELIGEVVIDQTE